MLHAIGDQFEDSEDVVGLMFIQRKNDHRIQLWMKNARNEAAIIRVGNAIKKVVDTTVNIAFSAHDPKADPGCAYLAEGSNEITKVPTSR